MPLDDPFENSPQLASHYARNGEVNPFAYSGSPYVINYDELKGGKRYHDVYYGGQVIHDVHFMHRPVFHLTWPQFFLFVTFVFTGVLFCIWWMLKGHSLKDIDDTGDV